MNENKNMIAVLTKRSFKNSKTRNMVAILAIMLTTIMFTVLFVLSQSMTKNLVEMAFRQTGYNAHISFKSIDDEQIELIKKHPEVKEYGTSIVVGLGSNKSLSGRQVEVRSADDAYAKSSFSWPVTGTMPQKENEVALDTLILDRLGIPHELGQSVTIDLLKDMSTQETEERTFTLCGFWEGNANVYASMAWVSRAFALTATEGTNDVKEKSLCGLRMMQVTLNSERDLEGQMDAILAELGLSELEYGVNLAYDPFTQSLGAAENLSMYLGMVLVFIAGYLIIYNIFQISVTTDIQFYGKLKTLGTSKRQLKRIIFGQANRLCIIGIPIGLLIGYLLGARLVPILISTMGAKPSISYSPVIFLGAALFGWLTVLISCMHPAAIAGKVSPMEALRYSDVQGGKKKTKKGVNGASLLGMAWSNLFRNKKRTVTLICSLSLGLVLLSCFYAKDKSFDIEKYLFSQMISDFQIEDATNSDSINNYNPQGTTITAELISEIEELDGLENTGYLYSAEEIIPLSDMALSNMKVFYEKKDRLKQMEYNQYWIKGYHDSIDSKTIGSIFYGADGIVQDTLTSSDNILSGEFDKEKFETGKYLLAIVPQMETIEEPLPSFSVGETLTLNGVSYTIMALVGSMEPITSGAQSYGFSLEFVMPADTFQSLYPENTIRKAYFNMAEAETDAAETLLREYQKNVDSSMPYSSRQTKIEQYEAETQSSAVMGTSVSIVIALVGVLNFINSMVTSIVSRKKEFAMLQSVGMTKKQLRNMLLFEGLYYALITLLLSIIISALAVGIGVRALVEGGYTTFHFTLFPLIVCAPIILLFSVAVPFICCKNIERQSLVERLGSID